ncbi:MAG: site-specific DNA-methyltransferase [Gammaproteobacteria bacterium AqS3]|nr:site-specific DNA-methyltransferase [Gammaproteobacteria bacterium AqS3]
MLIEEQYTNTILHADALDINVLPPSCSDVIITSPPYNVGVEYSKENKDSDALFYEEYISKFTDTWLHNCYHWGKEQARLCVNVFFDNPRGGRTLMVGDINRQALKQGWQFRSIIFWTKSNGRRTCWGSWKSATAPNIVQACEAILIYHKGEWKRKGGTSDIEGEEFKNWTHGIWDFRSEVASNIGHPAPFPYELPKRLIKLFSFKEDIVLDPFMGSGTTALAAGALGRKYIGIEKEKEYINLARNRLGLHLGA